MAFDFTEALVQAGMTEEAAAALSAAVGAGTPVPIGAQELTDGSGFGVAAALPTGWGPFMLCSPEVDEGGVFTAFVPTLWETVTVSALVFGRGSGDVVLQAGVLGQPLEDQMTVAMTTANQEIELLTITPTAYSADMGGVTVVFLRAGTDEEVGFMDDDLAVVGFTIRNATT